MTYTLMLRQRLDVVRNRYEISRIDGAGEIPLAHAEQQRLALRERITFYDDDRDRDRDREVAFTLAARTIVDLAGSYTVADASGAPLGFLRKDALASSTRSTYHLDTLAGELVGRERGRARALLRRLVDLLGEVPWVLPVHFDVTDPGGSVVLSVERRASVRDTYRITVHDDDLDWRLAAAFGVAVDAFMGR